MKYKVLYDTLINKAHTKKGSIIDESDLDDGLINRLVANKVIEEVAEDDKKKEKKKDLDSK